MGWYQKLHSSILITRQSLSTGVTFPANMNFNFISSAIVFTFLSSAPNNICPGHSCPTFAKIKDCNPFFNNRGSVNTGAWRALKPDYDRRDELIAHSEVPLSDTPQTQLNTTIKIYYCGSQTCLFVSLTLSYIFWGPIIVTMGKPRGLFERAPRQMTQNPKIDFLKP